MFILSTLFVRFGSVRFGSVRFGSVRFGLPITNILLSKALFCSFFPSVSGFIRCCVGSLVGDGFLGLLHLVLLYSTLVLLSCQTAT